MILHFFAASPQPPVFSGKVPEHDDFSFVPLDSYGVSLWVCYVVVTEYSIRPQKELHRRYWVSYSFQVLSYHTCTQELSSPNQRCTKNCCSILVPRVLNPPGSHGAIFASEAMERDLVICLPLMKKCQPIYRLS